MRVLVHAGMQKTGSSAIQKYLSEQRAGLADIGIHYPDFGYKNHWPLGFALGETGANNYMNRRARKDGNDKDIRRLTLDSIKRTIDEGSDDSWMVLSHESLGIKTLATNLRALLTNDSGPVDVSAIAYVRPPQTHFPSEIQQMLKSGNIAFPSLAEWKLVHGKRAAHLREMFGERVHVRVYSPSTLMNGDVVEDFRAVASDIVGRDFPRPQADVIANVAYTGPACALLLQYVEQMRDTGKPYRALRRALSRFRGDRPDPKLRLPDAWRSKFGAETVGEWNGLIADIVKDDEVRQDLELSHAAGGPTIRRRDVADWVRSYSDASFNAAFTAFCRREGGDEKGSWTHIVTWIEDRDPKG